MKRLFYAGLIGLVLFEILSVYLIMPMPGSQRMESLGTAYSLHSWRWLFRALFVAAIAIGSRATLRPTKRWHLLFPLLTVPVAAALVWFVNFRMAADHMFRSPQSLVFQARGANAVDEDSVVVGVEHAGEAKAYPIRFLVYHHQVEDSIGGQPVLVTYCSVCRTGRVFEPLVGGRPETFRLVGMDHFNAMLEDATTRSWWRQATGEAVAGPLKGSALSEVESSQTTLRKWFELHPDARVMQGDAASAEHYDPLARYERGESQSDLTCTDLASWGEKSWVIGVALGGVEKAYDWNRLKERRVLNDVVGSTPIVLALALDGSSFAAFERPAGGAEFTIADDVLSADGRSYDFAGRELASPDRRLKPLPAHQEYWHSWRTFHPDTLQDR